MRYAEVEGSDGPKIVFRLAWEQTPTYKSRWNVADTLFIDYSTRTDLFIYFNSPFVSTEIQAEFGRLNTQRDG